MIADDCGGRENMQVLEEIVGFRMRWANTFEDGSGWDGWIRKKLYGVG
jgi:hypothetical protein